MRKKHFDGKRPSGGGSDKGRGGDRQDRGGYSGSKSHGDRKGRDGQDGRRDRGDRDSRGVRGDRDRDSRPARRTEGRSGERPARKFEGDRQERRPFDRDRDSRPAGRTEGRSGERPARKFEGDRQERRPFNRDRDSRPAGRTEGRSSERTFEKKFDKTYPDKGGKRDGAYKAGERSSEHRGDRSGKPPFRPARQGPGDAPRFDRPQGRDRYPRREKAPAAPKIPLQDPLWGAHAVAEAWTNPARQIRAFHVTEDALKDFLPVYERVKDAGLKRPLPNVVDKKELDRSLPPGAVHQGIVCDAAPLDEIFVLDLMIRAADREKSVFIMLDQVTDPHNVGAILRSASAFGAAGVIMQSRNAPEITGTLAKTACGAVEHIGVAYETNLGRALAQMQEQGYTAIGLDERGPQTIAEISVPAKVVLVLGAEGKGLRQNLREQCNTLARLPTEGPILSLNVSNAAAVALYALSLA